MLETPARTKVRANARATAHRAAKTNHSAQSAGSQAACGDQPADVRSRPRFQMTTKPLGQLCDFIRGVTFDKAHVSVDHRAGYLPILRAGNISGELDTRSDLVWVPSRNVADEQKLRRNDIAICMSSGSSE